MNRMIYVKKLYRKKKMEGKKVKKILMVLCGILITVFVHLCNFQIFHSGVHFMIKC